MKTSKLFKLSCLVIVLVMLLSAMPISAAYTPIVGESAKAPQAASAGQINVVLRDFGTAGQKPDLSAHVTDAVNFEVWPTALAKTEGTSNSVYSATANNTHLIIKDLVGESVEKGFIYSADYYFGDDYINGTVDSDVSSCVQFISFVDFEYATVARLGHDGTVYATLKSGAPAIPGVKISPNKWFNFKTEVIPSGTSYTYYIYIDDVLVYSGTWGTVQKKAMGYRILAGDKDVGTSCMLDNIKFRTLPILPASDRVDTTIDFENIPDGEFTNMVTGPFIKAENLGPYLNTSNTAVHTSWEGDTTMNSNIPKLADDAEHNRVWQNASSKAHFAIEDVNKRLVARDFTVSADMMFTLFPTDKTSLIQWLRGSATLSGSKINEFLYIDASGNFCQNGVELGVKTNLNEWFNVTLRVSYVSHGIYNVATYINGKLVSVCDMAIASSNYATDKSFIRFFSTANTKFTARLDNVQVYESDNVKIEEVNDVLWNMTFDGLANNTPMNLSTLRSFSTFCDSVRDGMGTTAVVSNERLKISATLNKWIDVKLGDGMNDPVKEGPVSFSFKFNLESKTTSATASHRIIGIRRVAGIPESANGKTVDVINLINNDLYFFGTKVMSNLELNKDYKINAIVDGRKSVASLYIDDEKVIDSLSVANKMGAAGALGENMSYVTDNAGNKCYLPYTGFAYQQKYDENGEAIANTYVKRFIQTTGYGVDMLRLFQTGTAEPTGLVYYIDDIKIEKLDKDNNFISTDFTGWSKLTNKNPTTTNNTTYGHMSFSDLNPYPTIEIDEDGNEYLHCDNVERMFIADRLQEALYQSMELSFDMCYNQLEAPSKTGTTGIVNIFLSPTIADNPFNYNTAMQNVLQADEKGNIYTQAGTKIIENADGKWFNVKIELIGDGTKWSAYNYYIDGKFVGSMERNITGSKDYVIRILPNNRCSLDIDNVSYKYVVPSTETYDFNLDFDGDYESMLTAIGSDNKYPAIGTSRTDANGGTVVTSQILGDTDKFLRIDRTLLAADQTGYINASSAKYIGEKEYIVEADFRFSNDAGFGITPVTIIGEKGETQFIPVEVVGAKNTLNMNMRGAHYDLYNAAGTLLNVKTTEDDGFTKLAILVNENALTYTVYVDGSIAYYYYDGEYLPCVEIPMTLTETGISGANGAMLKLMAVDSIRHNYSIIDIDRIAITPAPSTLASTFVATQSRVNTDAETFDVRFIAGLDSLYGSKVGFEIKAIYTDGSEKTVEKEFSSNEVFASIENDGETIEASEFECKYLSVMSITKLPIDAGEVTFEVTPFVEYGTIRCLGEAKTIVAVCDGATVTIK